jgi:putative heme uptake system protein
MEYRPIPLRGNSLEEKVVDIGIIRTIEALCGRDGNVLLASHDADFLSSLEALRESRNRRIGLLVFNELVSDSLRRVPGIEIYDLEDDVGAFDFVLPRVRIIPIDQFDPSLFL